MGKKREGDIMSAEMAAGREKVAKKRAALGSHQGGGKSRRNCRKAGEILWE